MKMKGTNQHGTASSFLLVVVSMVVSFLIIISPVVACAVTHNYTDIENVAINTESPQNEEQTSVTKNENTIDESIYNENNKIDEKTQENINTQEETVEKERINFLLLGVDEDGTRTDTIMAATFETATGKMGVISIPRDTRIKIRDDIYNTLKSEDRYVPSSGYSKINSIHEYGGKKYGIDFAELQIETLLGIEFDFYVRINLDAFAYIVDSIGGITLTIPEGGMKSRDHIRFMEINLPGGTHTFSGKEAEQFVRMREIYPDADLGRIRNQQTFVAQFLKQVLQKDTIINNLHNYAFVVLNYIKTNFTIDDVPVYAKYLKVIDTENIHFKTLPGTPGDLNGGSYYLYDVEETAALVEEMFNPTKEEQPLQAIEN